MINDVVVIIVQWVQVLSDPRCERCESLCLLKEKTQLQPCAYYAFPHNPENKDAMIFLSDRGKTKTI